jgi:cytochrome P450
MPRVIPRARGIPILGVLPEVSKAPLDFFLNTSIKFGGIVQLDLGPRRMTLVTSPEAVKYILLDNNKNFVKGYDKVKPFIGQGLVSSDGDLWRRQRRLIQPLFNRSSMVALLPIMVEATRTAIDEWAARLRAGQPVDMAQEMMLLTQTIILRTMFSTDMGTRTAQIADDFGAILAQMNAMLFSPVEFLNRMPLPVNRRGQAALKRLDAVLAQFIADRRKQGAHERVDLLSVLLEAREENGQGMSDQQIRDELMTIFLAGHETTATLLAWTWLLIGQHPEVEQKMAVEFDAVLGGRIPNAEEINQLFYTRQVLDEALRLYPPAWMFARRLIEADEIGGYPMRAGQAVMLSPYVTHRLPQYWPEPAKFDPGRFAPEAADKLRFTYFPFGGGPRQCIGMPFTLLEAPLILAMMFQTFRLELVPGQHVRPTPLATLRPKPAIWMQLRK